MPEMVRLKPDTTTVKLSLVVVASLTIASLLQAQGTSELDDILRLADERRQEYIEAFKNLTSTETQVTEAFDRNGKVEKRRTVVSDFLVYRSDLGDDDSGVMEFRVAREVDGKPVGNSTENAIALFQRLAKTNTLVKQRDQLKKAHLKYALRYATFGYTLAPWLRKAAQSGLEFSLVARERIAGREAIVVGYRSKELHPVSNERAYRTFTNARNGFAGRAWLDVKDGRLLHWIDEFIVVDRDFTTPVTFMRSEIDFEPSAFGVWTPKRIVASLFRKTGDRRAPTTYEDARITFTYEPFKRFEVTTQTDIQAPR